MLSIRSSAAMVRALNLPLPVELRVLLAKRMAQLSEFDDYELGELAHFLIVRPGDALSSIDAEMGFPILANFIDGSRFGDDDGFTPSWEWVQAHLGWFEIVFILSDDGFGWVLFVEDREGTDPTLLTACRTFALPVE